MTDFYQSPADKLRFEILLKSLREGRLNLAILGDDELALTHYGRRIFQHLREQGEPNVELWTSADSERLVDRFNEILSSLTLDQALDKSNKTAPKRYMIFPDTHGIQDFELQLLARLVNGFPASNINVILLVNSHSAYDKKLSAFGKNLLQWVLESEAPAAAKPPRVETLGDWPGAKEVVVEKKPIPPAKPVEAGMSLPPAPPPPLDLSDIKPSDSSGQASGDDPAMGSLVPGSESLSGEELAKSWESQHTAKPGGGRIAMVLLLALLLALGVSGFIYQDRMWEEWQGMRAYLAGTKPTAPTPAVTPAPPPPPPPTVSMSSSNTTAVKPTEALSPGKEELVSNTPEPAKSSEPVPADTKVKSEPQGPTPEQAKTTVAKPEKEPVKPSAEPNKTAKEPVKEPAKETIKEATKASSEPVKASIEPAKKPRPEEKPVDKPVKAETKSEPKPDNKAKTESLTSDKSNKADSPAWVEALDPNAWVMQHGAFESLTEARNFQATSLGYQSGQVLYTQRKGSKPYYILVTGPYTDKAQAEALMKQNPPLAKAWVRSAKSLKAQFQD